MQWEKSDDAALRWFALANTGASQDYADLRAPAQFSVRARNGACAQEAASNAVIVPP